MKKFYKPLFYFVFTYSFSYIFWGIAIIFNGSAIITRIFHYIGGASPLISVLILVFGTKDKNFIKNFWRRVINFKSISPKGYALIFLAYPTLVILSITISLAFGFSEKQFDINSNFLSINIVPITFFLLFFGPIPEELGWRGYALDGLRSKFNGFVSSLILGLLWAFWHLPLFKIEGTYQNRLSENILSLILFFLMIIVISFYATFFYYKYKRSILSAILFHFVVNFTGEFFHEIIPQTDLILFLIMLIGIIPLVLINKEIFFKKQFKIP